MRGRGRRWACGGAPCCFFLPLLPIPSTPRETHAPGAHFHLPVIDFFFRFRRDGEFEVTVRRIVTIAGICLLGLRRGGAVHVDGVDGVAIAGGHSAPPSVPRPSLAARSPLLSSPRASLGHAVVVWLEIGAIGSRFSTLLIYRDYPIERVNTGGQEPWLSRLALASTFLAV